MSRGQLWLVRHGATEWSTSGRHTGTTDIALTEAGREAARRAGRALQSHSFELVLTSPLSRARETCELAGYGDVAVIIDDLREWDYGEVEGITTDAMRESIPGWTVWRDGCPGGETIDEVGDRADRVIARARGAGGDVLAFAHGHVLRVLAARWVGEPAGFAERLLLSTAATSVLGWERETPAIERWNDTTAADG
jgi:probable phosphoglycerate mutase